MAGRDPYPGENESGHSDLRDHARYFSRIVRGKLTSVDNSIGKCQVNTLEIYGTRDVTIPPLWFSGQGRKTAWGRYMPFGNEDVHVAYRNDDTAVILGYDIKNSGEQPDEGYAFLKQLADEGKAGYAVFRELKPGEFDYKSSGDAYIHGSDQGTLYLAGGQAFIKLDKQSYRLESKAAEYHYSSESAQMRFGTVFRKENVTDQSETPTSSGLYKEYLVDVNFPSPAGTPGIQSRAKLHMGDILDSTNTPEDGPSGNPLRFRLSLGDGSDSTEIFSLLIDNSGNVHWVQSETGESGFNLSALNITLTNGTDGNIKFGSDSADENIVLGKILKQALTDFVNDVFISNASAFAVGNMGAPVPLNPAVVASINQWLAQNVSNNAILSDKIFSEKT